MHTWSLLLCSVLYHASWFCKLLHSRDWCMFVAKKKAQFYSVRSWVMYSHFASSCLFEAKIAAIFTLFPLIDAFRLCKLLLHLSSKDWCNTILLSTGRCFQIPCQAAVSLQQRLVQCYSVEYWVILSDSALLHGCSKDGAICLSWLLADALRFFELHFGSKNSCNALLSIGDCFQILHSASLQQRLVLGHLRLVDLRLL